jgi:hypothetical protein
MSRRLAEGAHRRKHRKRKQIEFDGASGAPGCPPIEAPEALGSGARTLPTQKTPRRHLHDAEYRYAVVQTSPDPSGVQ